MTETPRTPDFSDLPAIPTSDAPAPPTPAAPPAPPAPAPAVPAPPAAAPVAVYPDGKPMLTATGQPASTRSRLAAALLCFFLGALGIHRFYVGKIGTGILMIITLGGLGIWALIDFIVILVGAFRDKEGRVLSNW